MGKIVKYCNSCDEGFAEKFAFCPNCAQSLEAFEMNPVQAAAPPAEEAAPSAPTVVEAAPIVVATPMVEAAPGTEAFSQVEDLSEQEPDIQPSPTELQTAPADENILELEPENELDEEAEMVADAPEVPAAAAAPAFVFSRPVDVDKPISYNVDQRPASFEAAHDAAVADGGFYVTVMEEKNAGQRNLLLLGTLEFMVMFMMGLTVYS
jgi:hypothetical protein